MSGAAKTPAWWYGAAAIPWHARALEPIYAAAIRLRRGLYRRGWLKRERVDAPVVVVGNFTAGGTGKTPLVIALVRHLQQQGYRPGVASRGYGRADAGTPRWVEAASDPATHGDEAVLIARRTGAKVRVDADRVAAARALREAGCDVIVCDDGLQHLRLQRDVGIEVVDPMRRHGNGRLLPAGPLREFPHEADAVDFHVVNHGTAAVPDAPQMGEWPMRLAVGHPIPLGGGRPQALEQFIGRRVHAVAGIGQPERFFDMLRAAGIGVIPHPFPDHHAFAPDDLHFDSALPILMTEKDAVKCAAFAPEDSWCVGIEARLPEAFWLALDQKLPLPVQNATHEPVA